MSEAEHGLAETRKQLARCMALIRDVESGRIERTPNSWISWDKRRTLRTPHTNIWDAFEAVESEAQNDHD